MNEHWKRAIISLSLAALTTGAATPVWAHTDGADQPMPLPIHAPILISAGAAWQGHWAEQDLVLLRSSVGNQLEALLHGAVDPDEALPIQVLADVLAYMFGAGGEQGDALERAVQLALIRPTDFATEQIPAEQGVDRDVFALLLARALQVNGAEDATIQLAPTFVDAEEIQTKYRAAVALMQAEGLLVGDGQGHFFPSQQVTYAQAVRTLVKASAWSQAQTAKLAGLNPAGATYLIDGQTITLEDGVAERASAPESATKIVTKLSNRMAAGDLTGDGQIDMAAVLTQGGGSGTFYYVAVVQHDGTPVAAAFLGDRVIVQNVRIVDGQVAVDLLTRGAEDAMTVRPYIKESRLFEVQDGALIPADS